MNLDILLQGTQRENERCMAELERYAVSVSHSCSLLTIRRGKAREKMLERELEKLAGANWQACPSNVSSFQTDNMSRL